MANFGGERGRQHFRRLLTRSETEGRQNQRSKCNHTAAPHHMVERHLWSTFDPAFEMGNVYRVQNKERPGAIGREQSNEGMAPPLRFAGYAGGEEVEKQANAGNAQDVTVMRRGADKFESGRDQSNDR